VAKQKKPRPRPGKSTEPTVSQQRQAYYEARARRQSLDELGVTEGEPIRPEPESLDTSAPRAHSIGDRYSERR